MRILPILIALLGLIVSKGEAHAQIVNVLPAAHAEQEGLAGTLRAPLDWSRGNTREISTGLSAQLRWWTDPHFLLLSLNGELGRADGATFRRSTMAHLRYRLQLGARVAGETFVQHTWNPFRRLQTRALFGIGPRITLLDTPRASGHFGTAWMPEWEHYTRREGATDSDVRIFTHRSSSYLQLGLQLTDHLSLQHTSFVQPAFAEPADLRLASTTALRIAAIKGVFIEIDHHLEYDTRAAEDVEPLDERVRLMLGVNF